LHIVEINCEKGCVMTQTDIWWNLFLAILGINYTIKLILNRMNYLYISQNKNQVPEKFQGKISLEDHQKAARYTRANLNFSQTSNLISILFILAVFKLDIIAKIDIWARAFSQNEVLVGLIFFFGFMILSSLINLPLELYKTFKIEEDFGHNKMTLAFFFKDKIKELFLSLIMGSLLIAPLLWVMASYENSWWLLGWLFVVLFQFIVMWAYPRFIAPLFNKFTKLESGELKEKIDELTQSCEISFKDYYTMDASVRSSHGNAYFTGFGKNKRIVLFDTLQESLSPNETKAVLAHEMGHLYYKHIVKSLITMVFGLLLGFYTLFLISNEVLFYKTFTSAIPSTHVALFLFQIIVPYFLFFLTPIFSFLSRKKEYQADEFASQHSNANDLINALLKLYKDNSSFLLSHPWYSKFYYSHPPAPERVAFLESCINSTHD
jgi:STE24 endopeptidase